MSHFDQCQWENFQLLVTSRFVCRWFRLYAASVYVYIHLSNSHYHGDCVQLLSLRTLKVWVRSYSVAALAGRACGSSSILWTASSLGSRSCLCQENRQGSSEPWWSLLVLKVSVRKRFVIRFVKLASTLSFHFYFIIVFRRESALLWTCSHHGSHLPC